MLDRWTPSDALRANWSRHLVTFGDGPDACRRRERALHRVGRMFAHHPAIRAITLRVLRDYWVNNRDQVGQCQAIQQWVQGNIRWVPEAGEQFWTPIRTLYVGGGDCDDHAALVISMLGSIRIPGRPGIVRRNGIGVHAFPLAGLPAKRPVAWIPLETSLPVPFGFDPRTATRDQLRRTL